ncbi:hypothetical protein L6250_03705 [Candidatus Parcubacteria bacterium]|nr:hypothetical protein [Patescibacteria group bacterium]MBU4466778.1 hypothetical protein [Patescibacteria group bacterium]MCG2688707.1 hypothetical protein [Candidatus Parcubacteria bacterium]
MQAQPAFYKCPVCGSIITEIKYLSGNTIGAVFFSDAYLEAPMMPPYGITYIGCTNCGEVFLSVPNEVKIGGEEAQKALEGASQMIAQLQNIVETEKENIEAKKAEFFKI